MRRTDASGHQVEDCLIGELVVEAPANGDGLDLIGLQLHLAGSELLEACAFDFALFGVRFEGLIQPSYSLARAVRSK